MNSPDRSKPDPKPLARRLAVAALLSAFILLAVTSMWDKSPTADEELYCLGPGYSYLKTGDPTMASWFHPVLGPIIGGVPLLALDLEDPTTILGWKQEVMIYGPVFLHYNRTEAQVIVRAGRVGFIGVAVTLGLGVYLWSRRLFGPKGAMLSLLLFVVAPNMLAHAPLATTDLLLAATMLWATFLFHEHLRRPRVMTAVAAGGLAGLALLSKVSGLLMFPAWVVLAVIHLVRSDEGGENPRSGSEPREAGSRGLLGRRAGGLVVSAVLMAGVAVLVIGAAYGFRYGRAWTVEEAASGAGEGGHRLHGWSLAEFEKTRRFLPLPRAYLDNVYAFLDKARTGHPGYLFGEVDGPWWYYFPVAYMLKTPLGMIVLTGMAIALLPWSARPRWGLEVLVVPLLFLGACMTSSVNTGYRHILPIVPFLLVFVGTLGTVRFRGVRVLHVLVAALVAWTAFSSLMVYPDYLAYFNELAGGPEGGYRYLGDSNLDWGQDVLALAKYVKANRIDEPVKVFVHTMTPIENLGFEAVDGFSQRDPKPGWYALSTTVMQGIYESPRRAERFRWLLKFEPTTIIGHTIRVYHITEAELDNPRGGGGT